MNEMTNFKQLILIPLVLALSIGLADAKGGSSSGGGGGRSGGGSMSSGSRPSTGSMSASRPSTTSSVPRTTTTTTSTTRSSYVSSHPGYYGGFGMAYGYNNGLLTGLIIGGMMHPYGTVLYAGPGMYANNALLYPNGQVVNQQGMLVGTYAGGQFVPGGGQMVAQPIPADAGEPSAAPQQMAQPVVIQQGPSGWEIFFVMLGVLALVSMIVLFVGVFL